MMNIYFLLCLFALCADAVLTANSLTLHTLAWISPDNYTVLSNPLPATGLLVVDEHMNLLMLEHYAREEFVAGSSYCTLRVHRWYPNDAGASEEDIRDVVVPVRLGTRVVDNRVFYMYEFTSVVEREDMRVELIEFGVHVLGCPDDSNDSDEDDQGEDEQK